MNKNRNQNWTTTPRRCLYRWHHWQWSTSHEMLIVCVNRHLFSSFCRTVLYCTLHCLYVSRMKQRSHYLSASQQTNRRNNEDPNNTRVIASDTSILDFSVVASSTDSVGVAVDTDRGGGGAMSRVQGCLFKQWVDRIALKVHQHIWVCLFKKSRMFNTSCVWVCWWFAGGGLFKSVNVFDRFMLCSLLFLKNIFVVHRNLWNNGFFTVHNMSRNLWGGGVKTSF